MTAPSQDVKGCARTRCSQLLECWMIVCKQNMVLLSIF